MLRPHAASLLRIGPPSSCQDGVPFDILPMAPSSMNEACFDARTLHNLSFSTSLPLAVSPCATPVPPGTLEDVELAHVFSMGTQREEPVVEKCHLFSDTLGLGHVFYPQRLSGLSLMSSLSLYKTISSIVPHAAAEHRSAG